MDTPHSFYSNDAARRSLPTPQRVLADVLPALAIELSENRLKHDTFLRHDVCACSAISTTHDGARPRTIPSLKFRR
jgi:hypothetical protein